MKKLFLLTIGLLFVFSVSWANNSGIIGSPISKWIESGHDTYHDTYRVLLGGPIIPTADEIWQWRLINAVRANPAGAGWPQYQPAGPLAMNYNLTDAARFHSQEMIDNKYFDHDSKDASGASYETAFERIKRFGYEADSPGGWLGENIAGCATVEVAMDLWMNSTGHRENILKPEFTEIGIGIKKGGPFGKMFTNDFGYRSISYDLAITDPDSDLYWRQTGDTLVLSAWITNIGKTHAFPVYVAFYDGDPKQSGKLIAPPESVPVLLRPQEKGLAEVNWHHPHEGQHQVFVVVDPDNKFKETNENNNTASFPVTMAVEEVAYGLNPISRIDSRPNPASAKTEIEYTVNTACPVNLAIYNSAGQLVKNLVLGQQRPGTYRLVWNGQNDSGRVVRSGVYFIRLTTPRCQQMKKIVLLGN
jgi:hypothetical protein